MKKKQVDQEIFYLFDFFSPLQWSSMLMGKILNLKLIIFFLIKLIFSPHKTDMFSLVLLYMWVTYELI